MLNLKDHKVLTSIHEKQFDALSIEQGKVSLDDALTELSVAMKLENEIIDSEDDFIDMSNCPAISVNFDENDFISHLKKVIREHDANLHPFYEDFLPNQASVSDISFYLAQETLQDPRFDDFIAYLQIGLPVEMKLELAANYWDEMGNGIKSQVHTVMFDETIAKLGFSKDFAQQNLTQDGLQCGNLSALLVLRRNFLFRAIGYFATIEYLFPQRCLSLITAWNRLGLPEEGVVYHKEHVKVDAKHAFGFFQNVIKPLIKMKPECAPEIYWGVCARLNSSNRHLNSLLRELRD